MNGVDKFFLEEMIQEDMAEILHLEEDTELIDGFIPEDYEESLRKEESVDENYVPSIDDLF